MANLRFPFFIIFALLLSMTLSANAEVETTPKSTLSPSYPLFNWNTLNEWNKTISQAMESNFTNLMPYNALVNATMASDLAKQFETLQTQYNPLVDMLYNTSRTSVQAGTAVLTESLARPATFFIGQNLRLLGNGLGTLGHTLKYSGYHISNLEPVIQNVSQALSEYGINLVNASMNVSKPLQH